MMRRIFPFFDQHLSQGQLASSSERNVWHLLPGRLSFAVVERSPMSTTQLDCFTTDHSLVYRPFNNDFGPLNMSCLYKFCQMMLIKMHSKDFIHGQKQLVYFTYASSNTMENAAFLIGSFAALYLRFSPEYCRDQLTQNFDINWHPYRDAGFQAHSNTIMLYDCFCGLVKASSLNFFNFALPIDAALQQVLEQSVQKVLTSNGYLSSTASSTDSSTSSTPSGSPFQENVDFNQQGRVNASQSPLKNALLSSPSAKITVSSVAARQANGNASLGALSVKAIAADAALGRTLKSLDSPIFHGDGANSMNPYRLAHCAPFNVDRYEFLEDISNGDMSWLIPGKFLALATPRDEQLESSPGNNLSPQQVIPILKRENIAAVVRLNNRVYDRQTFLDAGMLHYDLFFPDCTIPPEHVLAKFLRIAEQEPNAMAVHCRAGLGRTGTLIAAYMIKNFKMTAREAIAYIRVCRPGSIIGAQQDFLEQIEPALMSGELQLSEEEDPDHAAARLRAERQETENEQGGSHAKRLLLGNMELRAVAVPKGPAYVAPTVASYQHLQQQQQQQQQQQVKAPAQAITPSMGQTRYQLRSSNPAMNVETKRSLNSLRLAGVPTTSPMPLLASPASNLRSAAL